MGLDASVMCNCYQQGLTTTCPYPEYFVVDEDGYPALKLPYDNNEDAFNTFEEWLALCCVHPHMDYASVFIASWKDYQSFLEALEQLGHDQFPALLVELPTANQGHTSPGVARAALAEFELFKTKVGEISKAFLINTETREAIGSSAMAYGGLFSLDNRTGLNLSFDEAGFVITDVWEFNREMFRAMRFEQRPLELESLDRPQQFEYIDLDSGRTYTCSTPVKLFVRDENDQLRQEYPSSLHIEQRAITSDYYKDILDPLERIFRASLETGNPVRWS